MVGGRPAVSPIPGMKNLLKKAYNLKFIKRRRAD
jgi:hypothetical protein